MTMKKSLPKAPLRTLASELIKVKGGTDPTPPNPVPPPPDDPNCRAHIIDLG
jgi:hypothetical protein